jgi:hypothetical protein
MRIDMKIQIIFCMTLIMVLISGFFVLSLPAAERPYLEAALKAAQWLEKAAVRTPHGLAWPADPQDPKSVNNSLYAGTPGPGSSCFTWMPLSRESAPKSISRIPYLPVILCR